jgi:Ca2+-binding EF-hand superfamily protein
VAAGSAIENLKNFHTESKLKQAATTFISAQLSTKKEQQQLRQTFNLFDINGDGKIELIEFI